MEEEFKDIIGFEDYQISDKGNVYNKNSGIIQAKRYAGRNKEYVQVCLWKNSKHYYKYIHRLVAIHFIENEHNYDQINHIDGNKKNNNYENLEWCTAKHNMNHAFINGLQPSGEKRSTAMFTKEQILNIYKDSKNKSGSEIAREYKTSPNNINRILRGERYENLYRQYRDNF